MMLQRMTELLEKGEYEHWEILIREEQSHRRIYSKRDLKSSLTDEENRAIVTLYRDDDVNRGKASVAVTPAMDDRDIMEKLDEAYGAALKNMVPWYPLEDVHKEHHPLQEASAFHRHSLERWTESLAEALFKQDVLEGCFIESMKIHLADFKETFLNSNGQQCQFSGNNGAVDLTTAAEGDNMAPVELKGTYSFSAYEPEEMSQWVGSQLKFTQDKARGVKLPVLKALNVILREEAIPEFFSYWIHAVSGKAAYGKSSTVKIDSLLFPMEMDDGDRVSLLGLPRIYNAPSQCPFDSNGHWLQEIDLIIDGKVRALYCSNKFAHYLEQPVTGEFNCFSILPGSVDEEHLYREPYLEIISFNSFKMDRATGEFYGEIGLAYGYDGTKTTPYTGGSIKGNLDDNVASMGMLDRAKRQGDMLVPEALLLKSVEITSAE